MAEISIQSLKKRQFKIIKNGLFRPEETVVPKEMLVIELLLMLYREENIPSGINWRFFTAESWQQLEMRSGVMGLDVAASSTIKGEKEKQLVSYADSLARLYNILLSLKSEKAAQQALSPILIKNLQLALVGDSDGGDLSDPSLFEHGSARS